jgi:hypothetical protein
MLEGLFDHDHDHRRGLLAVDGKTPLIKQLRNTVRELAMISSALPRIGSSGGLTGSLGSGGHDHMSSIAGKLSRAGFFASFFFVSTKAIVVQQVKKEV